MSENVTKKPRVALVHDYLIRYGGAERVLKELHRMYPDAPIYTLLADPEVVSREFSDAEIRTSFVNKLPRVLKKRYKYFAPLLAIAVEQFDLSSYDIVISSSSAFAKGIITKPETLHIDYCHTPTRFLWDWTHPYVERSGSSRVKKGIMRLVLHVLRLWDFEAAQRPDYIIANSKNVQARIKKFYRRDAEVIYPPVSLRERKEGLVPLRGGSGPPREYFLIVSYLQTYKNVDIAVEAFTKLELPLVIIGTGPEQKRLEEIAGPTITFLGWQPDGVVASYIHGAKAFIFPTDEDFGIAPVEAMMAGKPVLALRRGGALEYVEEGITGIFFDDLHPVVLADGVRRLLESYCVFRPDVIRGRVAHFSKERFSEEMREYIDRCYHDSNSPAPLGPSGAQARA